LEQGAVLCVNSPGLSSAARVSVRQKKIHAHGEVVSKRSPAGLYGAQRAIGIDDAAVLGKRGGDRRSKEAKAGDIAVTMLLLTEATIPPTRCAASSATGRTWPTK
jgi:hypothetical protein